MECEHGFDCVSSVCRQELFASKIDRIKRKQLLFQRLARAGERQRAQTSSRAFFAEELACEAIENFKEIKFFSSSTLVRETVPVALFLAVAESAEKKFDNASKQMERTAREDVEITAAKRENAEATMCLARQKMAQADRKLEDADRRMRNADKILMDAEDMMEEAEMLVRQNDRRSMLLNRFEAESKADREIFEAMKSALEQRMPIADAKMFEAERRTREADERVKAVMAENVKLRQTIQMRQANFVLEMREDRQAGLVSDVLGSGANEGPDILEEAKEVVRPSNQVIAVECEDETGARPSELEYEQSNELDIESLSESRVWLVSSSSAAETVQRVTQISLKSTSGDASTISALRPEGGHAQWTTSQTKTLIVTGKEVMAQEVFNKLGALGYDLDIALLTNSDWKCKRHTEATMFREGERKILVCTLATALKAELHVHAESVSLAFWDMPEWKGIDRYCVKLGSIAAAAGIRSALHIRVFFQPRNHGNEMKRRMLGWLEVRGFRNN